MSKAYKLKIQGMNLEIHVNNDKVIQDFEVLPILPLAKMKELLENSLLKKGAEKQDGLLVLVVDKIRYSYDLENSKLEISLVKEAFNIDSLSLISPIIGTDKTISFEDLNNPDNTMIKNLVDKHIASMSSEIRKQAEVDLIKGIFNSRAILNEALKDVYSQAIKEKAGTLGKITSISESNDNGEFRIRLEIQ